MRSVMLAMAIVSLAGCGSDLIGWICPSDAPECDAPLDENDPSQFDSRFPPFDANAEGDFRVQWEVSAPCVGCERGQPRLFPNGPDAAWLRVQSESDAKLQIVSATMPSLPLIASGGTPRTPLNQHFASDLRGGVVEHVQVPLSRGWFDEITTTSEGGTRLSMGLNTRGARIPVPVAVAPAGLVFYTPAGLAQSLRLFDGAGNQVWELRQFPSKSRVGAGAATLDQDAIVVGGSRPLTGGVKYGLQWVGLDGKPQEYLIARSASWRALRLHPLAEGGVLAVAESDIVAALGDATGNIDIVRFTGRALHAGIRLMRTCYHDLAVRGYAVRNGVVWISTIVGDHVAPRALVCRVPLPPSDALPRCHQAPAPQLLLEDIAPTSDNSLLALSGEKLLYIELPD